MEHTRSNPPMSIEERHGGRITATATLIDPETQKKQPLIILRSEATKKIMLLLGLHPIEFDTPSGKQAWINGFGLLSGTNFLLINDGSTQSLGIYRCDGSRATLGFDTPFDTPEIIYRIENTCISSVNGDPFLLTATLRSLYDLPAYGPE